MNIKDLNKYYKRTETENIHLEIFKESPEYKYYLLGVAQGLYSIYKVMNNRKSKKVAFLNATKPRDFSGLFSTCRHSENPAKILNFADTPIP